MTIAPLAALRGLRGRRTAPAGDAMSGDAALAVSDDAAQLLAVRGELADAHQAYAALAAELAEVRGELAATVEANLEWQAWGDRLGAQYAVACAEVTRLRVERDAYAALHRVEVPAVIAAGLGAVPAGPAGFTASWHRSEADAAFAEADRRAASRDGRDT